MIGITIKETSDGNFLKPLAGLLAVATIGILVYWGIVLGFTIGTWVSFGLPLLAIALGSLSAVSYWKRRDSGYETLKLHTADGERVYSASEDTSLRNVSKVISKNWRKRAPKF